MLEVKVTAIGHALGIVLPEEALARLNAGEGDTLYLVDGPEGLTITPNPCTFEQQMRAADKVMKRYRHALEQLAK